MDSLDCVWTALSWQSLASQAWLKPHWNQRNYPNTCLSMSNQCSGHMTSMQCRIRTIHIVRGDCTLSNKNYKTKQKQTTWWDSLPEGVFLTDQAAMFHVSYALKHPSMKRLCGIFSKRKGNPPIPQPRINNELVKKGLRLVYIYWYSDSRIIVFSSWTTVSEIKISTYVHPSAWQLL